MDVTIFSTKAYDRRFLDEANAAAGGPHRLRYLEARLARESAPLGQGAAAVCVFVNDVLDRPVLEMLAASGTRMVALRSAGFNNVDLAAAAQLGIAVGRVPAYSPDSIAEHTVALILALNRNIQRAYARVREGNFALEGLLGFDLKGARPASSAPATSAWPSHVSSPASAAACWPTILGPRPNSPPSARRRWASTGSWPRRTSSPCTAR